MGTLSAILQNRRMVAAFVLLVVLGTLALDIAGLVHPCPYCRVQRFALGVLSIILLLKGYDRLLPRYVAAVTGLMGLVVGMTQNFNHIKKMNAGEFDWSAVSIGHPWVLSGLAVLTLVWQLFLIFDMDRAPAR
ncbi:disulfide bond formation protein B [Sandaracinobacter sp.]|jgi:disulfide bond formation protein DsbB|uniref:disulfide bond formation protein B n=1 Tax=Sandaracinobacter sp. TaxID=2487581 RepID=UPI0035B0B3F4